MASDLTHVLMTRFNLATPGRELAIRTQPGWLEGRFELFEKYCLPSVAAQTNKNFRWIIYFDKDTPQAFKDRIEDLRKIVDFHPYYTGLFPSDGWANSVAEVFSPETGMLLTTRLDNDDALASDFVERLHDAVSVQDAAPGSYNFTNGVIRHGRALYAHEHLSNAFFSWLEPAKDFRTASSIQHMTLAAIGPVFQIAGPPTWMQIIHETNVSNRIRGQRIPVADAGRFAGPAGQDMDDPNVIGLLLDRVLLAPIRRLRDAAAARLRGGSGPK